MSYKFKYLISTACPHKSILFPTVAVHVEKRFPIL
jgi:hypothetical protein